MSKITGPLLSMRARGQIGDALVFSTWKGVKYARQKVVPSNPDTDDQRTIRRPFAYLNDIWRRLGAGAYQPWELGVVGRPLTARNLFIKANLSALQEAVTLNTITGSIGAKGGPSVASATFDPAVAPGGIQVVLTPGSLPSGWEVSGGYAIALRQQDPHLALVSPPGETELLEDSGDFSGQITGLVPGMNYWVTAWLIYERSENDFAASPAVGSVVEATPE